MSQAAVKKVKREIAWNANKLGGKEWRKPSGRAVTVASDPAGNRTPGEEVRNHGGEQVGSRPAGEGVHALVAAAIVSPITNSKGRIKYLLPELQ